MAAFTFYSFDSPEYAADFQALLRSYSEPDLESFLAELFAAYDPASIAADWGAGSGALTRRLLARFRTVYAVEPHADMRAILANACPAARIIPAAMADAVLPEPVDVGFLRHVLYHVPDEAWGRCVLAAAGQLSPRGVLTVTLKHPDTACNTMIAAFGGRRFDLFTLDGAFRGHPEFRVERVVIRGIVRTTSFEETYRLARFMLCDRAPDSYARRFRDEELRDYVRDHFWNDREQAGGWPCDALNYCIRRNGYW
jgi:hypothetical protein